MMAMISAACMARMPGLGGAEKQKPTASRIAIPTKMCHEAALNPLTHHTRQLTLEISVVISRIVPQIR